MEPRPIHTVVLYPRLHVDPLVALFLLREFGAEHFPGIREAKIVYWGSVPPGKSADDFERDGILLVDMGGGTFDHHHEEHAEKTDCASTLVARYLGIEHMPALRKILAFAKRDDLEGKGVLSTDILDRAFGLPAIVMNLNRDYPDHPDFVVDVVYRILLAHSHEEYRRTILMPQEWQRLQREGKARRFTVNTPDEELRVVMVETDEKALVGFLRAISSVRADVVIQRSATGHTHVVTRNRPPRLNLRPTIAALRQAEAAKKEMDVRAVSTEEWEKPGRLAGVEEWYFDTAANTLQNGGAAAATTTPTRLSLDEIERILRQTLPNSLSGVLRSPSSP